MPPADNSSRYAIRGVGFSDKTLQHYLTRLIKIEHCAKYASCYDIIKFIGLCWPYAVW